MNVLEAKGKERTNTPHSKNEIKANNVPKKKNKRKFDTLMKSIIFKLR